MSIVYVLVSFALCYLLCSVNFAILISKAVLKTDIRSQGSNNAGTTNMMRTVGKGAGIATFLLDIAKGIAAMLICKCWLLPMTDIAPLYIRYCLLYFCAFFCILGHDFPLYFGFKGGKGIASALGVIYIIDWRIATFCFLTFIIIFCLCRIVSIGSVTAALLVAMTTFLVNTLEQGVGIGLISTISVAFPVSLLVIKHRSNIQKLIRGEEKQLTLKK